MHDFILRLHLVGGEVAVDGDCALAGQAGPAIVRRQDLAALGAASRRLLLTGGEEVASGVALGRQIFGTVLPGPVGELLRTSLASCSRAQEGLRLQLRLGDLAEVHDLAWELLHDGTRFLSMVPWISVVRYQELPCPVATPQVRPPLRVLFTSAQPDGCAALDLAGEERQVRVALQPLEDWLQLTVERNLSLARLRHLLLRAEDQKKPFSVWHHGGHGGLVRGAKGEHSFALMLEDRRRQEEAAGADLAAAVANCPRLQVVVLNVCHGAAPAGLAPALARLNVPVVVGFRTSILDSAALAFGSAFYRGLVRSPAEVAMGEARLALAYEGSRPLNWALPLLFSRSPKTVRLLAPSDHGDLR